MAKKYKVDPVLFSQLTELMIEWGIPAMLTGLAEIVSDRNFRDPKELEAVRFDRGLADELGQIADRCRATGRY